MFRARRRSLGHQPPKHLKFARACVRTLIQTPRPSPVAGDRHATAALDAELVTQDDVTLEVRRWHPVRAKTNGIELVQVAPP